ncbi:suppressor of tumorigenicity 14 protein-like [Salvelinus sp. IW2-2015]|uniref:suppressor of tumorigenicity 14 protein-like n=1 Tax=Salvelinus sp. IW2-2015 TaxID=2691554 RepID=UPI0038D4D81F
MPQLSKYYVGSPYKLQVHEGSVIAYYLSEFEVPRGQEAAVDKAMSSMDKVVDKVQRGFSNNRPGNDLLFEDVMNSALDSRMICGYHSPSSPLTFQSSRNVMLVTLVTNKENNYPGLRAQVSQVPRNSKELECGGQLSGETGEFHIPKLPKLLCSQHRCEWNIQVPAGKSVKVKFSTFLLLELGQENTKDCNKDYVEINNKR